MSTRVQLCLQIILAGILSRPVALYAFRPLKIEATLSTDIGDNFKNVSED
jgi:hypothetical protein